MSHPSKLMAAFVAISLFFSTQSFSQVVVNQAPVADAGLDQTYTVPVGGLTLNGTASTAVNGIASYQWTKISGTGGVFGSTSSSITSFSNLVASLYLVELTVTDSAGLMDRDTVAINILPIGGWGFVDKPIPGRIEAEAVYGGGGGILHTEPCIEGGLDVSTLVPGKYLTYKVSVAVARTYTAVFRVASPNGGSQFQVKIGDSVLATLMVPATYGNQNWTSVNAPITLPAGNQIITIVSLSSGWSFNRFDCITGTAPVNQAPVARAGNDMTLRLSDINGNTVVLFNNTSTDDNGIVSYLWTKINGNGGFLTSTTTPMTSVGGVTVGSYSIELKVTDMEGLIDRDTIVINILPAVVGPGKTLPGKVEAEAKDGGVTIGTFNEPCSEGGLNVAGLDSSKSLSYKVIVATGGTNIANFRVAAPSSGSQFKFKIDDSVLATITVPATYGYQNWTTVSVPITLPAGYHVITIESLKSGWNFNWFECVNGTVPVNQPPVARAGANQTIISPRSSAILDGSASTDDNGIVSYEWTKIGGGDVAIVNNLPDARADIYGLVVGSYILELKVTDTDVLVDRDTMYITVIPHVIDTSRTIPGRILAEAFNQQLGGVITERCSDVGGGLNVANILPGSWMKYNVNVLSAGTYVANFRVSSPSGGSQFQVKIGDSVLTTVTIPPTGNFQNWTTVTTGITLPEGSSTLRIEALTSGWNFNWFECVNGTVPVNQPPVARAGADQTVTLPTNSVTLNGTASTDDNGIVAYQWTVINGPGGTFSNATNSITTFTGNVVTHGDYLLELKVTDVNGLMGRDTVLVKILPMVVGLWQPIPGRIEAEIFYGHNGILTEPCSEGGFNVGALASGKSILYRLNIATAGTYIANFRVASPNGGSQFQVKIGDSVLAALTIPATYGYQNWTTITTPITLPAGNQTIKIESVIGGWNFNWFEFVNGITPVNQPPVARAGADQTIMLPLDSVMLNGAASTDDNGIVAYQWTKITGSGGLFTSATSSITNFIHLTAGTYLVELKVTDSAGLIGRDTVLVNVMPQIIGNGKTIPGRIEAEAFDDENGIITEPCSEGGLNVGALASGKQLVYNVSVTTAGTYVSNFRVSSPSGGSQFQVKIGDSVLAALTIPATYSYQNWTTITTPINLPAGNQTIRIESLTSGWNFNWFECVNGTVPVNQPPVARAGADQTVTLPTNSVTLNGTASTDDNGIASYQWTKISGIGGTFTSSSSSITNLTGLAAGTYTVYLKVTDASGLIGRDTVLINVLPQVVVTVKPIPGRIEAEAFDDENGIITEPCSEGGLNVGALASGKQLVYNVSVTTAGTYVSNFRVSSPSGGSQFQVKIGDSVLAALTIPATYSYQNWTTITTPIKLPAGNQTIRIESLTSGWNFNWFECLNGTVPVNQPPIARAGADQTIMLPLDSVILNGAASTDDNGISSYQWTKISGTGGLFTNATSSIANFIYLTAGTYSVELKVTDIAGLIGRDTVLINVMPQIIGNGKTIPGRIEAEAFDGENGIVTEPCSEGGLNVRNLLPGNWMEYNVNVATAGIYLANFRVSSIPGAAQFQVKIGDTVLTTMTVPNTNNNQTWVTITTPINLPVGNHRIRILSLKSSWNINWFECINTTTALNQPPIAKAGADRTVIYNYDPIQLDASSSTDDYGIATYQWTIISGVGGGFINPTSAMCELRGNTAGTYVVELTVTDVGSLVSKDTMLINVLPGASSIKNIPGRIEAESVDFGENYSKEHCSEGGLNVSSLNPNSKMHYIVNVANAGVYTANFRVASPVGGAQFLMKIGSTLIATVTVPATGGFQVWSTVSTSITLPAGNQTISIESLSSNWNFNWFECLNGTTPVNLPPVAKAGSDQTLSLPQNVVLLNGSFSTDDIGIDSYQWTKIIGNGGTLSNPTNAVTNFTGLSAGIYWLELKVTDTGSLESRDTVQVNVLPQIISGKVIPGRIEAEAFDSVNAVITEPCSEGGLNVGYLQAGSWLDYNVNVASAGNYLASFRIASLYRDTQFQVKIGDSVLTTVTMPVTGDYQKWVTITVPITLTTAGNQTIRIESLTSREAAWYMNWFECASGTMPPNQPPVARAGADQTITLPTNSVTLNGAASTDDNGIVSYQWRKIGGNNTGQLTIYASNPWLLYGSSLSPGTYVLELKVTDVESLSSRDTVVVTVLPTTTITTYSGRSPEQTTIAPKEDVIIGRDEFKLYPNPVKDEFTLQLDQDLVGKMTIDIYDMNGKLVKKINGTKNKGVRQFQLSASGLKTGMYILKVRINDWEKSIRLMKL